jgi:hypothetical protein
MTGLITDDSLFPQVIKKKGRVLKVAGIINWFGVTDLAKASTSWEAKNYKQVVGDSLYADSIFKVASPVNYVTASSPPVKPIEL